MKNRQRKKIFLVPHTHYDVVWAFNKKDYDYINEYILEKAVHMIKDGTGFKFIIEQAYALETMEKNKPELFADIIKMIDDNKIEIVDGTYIMPDLVIPGGETLIREILVGKRYIKNRFGKDVPVAYAADTFGLNAQMPQIYKKSGYKWLIFRRGYPKLLGRKVSEFIWQGLDGSQIISHWLPMGYRAGLDLNRWEETIEKLSHLATTDNVFMPCGSGGVPPQYEIPKMVNQWNKDHKKIKIRIAVPSEFFKDFEGEIKYIPVYRGELHSPELEDVFPDVVSSRISLKLAIKECENKLLLAEKLTALASLQNYNYPRNILYNLWKKMLFLANHDVMPSCGIDEIYIEAWDYIREIKAKTNSLIHKAAKFIVKERKDSNDLCIAVFNPYSWTVVDWVEIEIEFGKKRINKPAVKFKNQIIPSEIINIEKHKNGGISKAKIGFIAKVQPMNHNVYQICTGNKKFTTTISVLHNKIRTKFYTLIINKDTGIIELFDKNDSSILKGNEVIIDQELGDLYFHRQELEEFIGSESGKGIKFGAFKSEGLSIKKGTSRVVVTFKNSFYCLRWPYYLTEKFGAMLFRQKTLDLVKTVILYEDIPRIDFITYIDLKQPHVRIRLNFDTCMITPQYTRQTQFGAVEISDPKIYEEGISVPAPAWLTAQENNRGLAFLTPGVPVNEIKAGEIYYTLLRSVSVLSADGKSGPLIPTPGAMELGKHRYTYSIYLYQGDWRDADIYQSAYEFGQSLIPIQVNSAMNKRYQSFSISPSNLIISALKKAEDEDALIMRFFETEGKECKALIKIPSQVKAAKSVDLLENNENDLIIRNSKLVMDVKSFEIITLKLFY
jgi:alpha-mannosidase